MVRGGSKVKALPADAGATTARSCSRPCSVGGPIGRAISPRAHLTDSPPPTSSPKLLADGLIRSRAANRPGRRQAGDPPRHRARRQRHRRPRPQRRRSLLGRHRRSVGQGPRAAHRAPGPHGPPGGRARRAPAAEVADLATRPLLGTGVGTPGVVDPAGRIVRPRTWAGTTSIWPPPSPAPSPDRCVANDATSPPSVR